MPVNKQSLTGSISNESKYAMDLATRLDRKAMAEGHNSFLKKSAKDMDKDAIRKFAKDAASIVFGKELKASGESAGFTSNQGISALSKQGLLNSLNNEFQARFENVLQYSQSIGNYTTDITNLSAAQSVLLYPGVIQSTYNKIVQTTVEKKLFYDRQYDAPYLIGPHGERYDYYGTLRDSEALQKLMGKSSPEARIEMPVNATKGYVENVAGVTASQGTLANLVDSYNFGKAHPINGPRNYLNRGVEIVAIGYDKNGTTEQRAVTYVATSNQTQSGQLNDVVANIQLKLVDESNPAAEPIRIVGSVNANGDVDVLVTDPKVKTVTFKFVLPAIGMDSYLSIGRKKVPLRYWITKTEKFMTTINQEYIDVSEMMINEDVIEKFNQDVIVVANNMKDDWTFDWFKKHKNSMREAARVQGFINQETTLNRYALFAEGAVEMNNIIAGGASRGDKIFDLHNDMLANEIFKVCNAIELEINPLEKNFVMYSSSLASQWISDMAGNNVTKMNLISDGGDGTIAGLATPYTLNRIVINKHYTGWFVASNRLESEKKTNIDAPAFGAGAKGLGHVHTYTLIPRFEESKDSFIFLSGPEMFTKGTGTNEYVNYESINYEVKWDLACINKTIGEVTFTESPTKKTN